MKQTYVLENQVTKETTKLNFELDFGNPADLPTKYSWTITNEGNGENNNQYLLENALLDNLQQKKYSEPNVEYLINDILGDLKKNTQQEYKMYNYDINKPKEVKQEDCIVWNVRLTHSNNPIPTMLTVKFYFNEKGIELEHNLEEMFIESNVRNKKFIVSDKHKEQYMSDMNDIFATIHGLSDGMKTMSKVTGEFNKEQREGFLIHLKEQAQTLIDGINKSSNMLHLENAGCNRTLEINKPTEYSYQKELKVANKYDIGPHC